MKNIAFTALFALTCALPSQADPLNLAGSASADASTQLRGNTPAANAIDGQIEDDHRWVSAEGAGPHVLTLTWPAAFDFGGAHIYSGYGNRNPVSDYELRAWNEQTQRWETIAGSQARNNREAARRHVFQQPVNTTRIQFVVMDNGPARIKEVMLWPANEDVPELGAGIFDPLAPDLTMHHVFVNQIGYDLNGPKRFTAPISPNGSQFIIINEADEPLFAAPIHNGIGDFTAFRPETLGEEYRIRVRGNELSDGISYPFRIEPMLTLRNSFNPAVDFMIDVRSIVGTHPSGYGGSAWRDGTFYTFETPSLIMMWLANPSMVLHDPVEMDWQDDANRILHSGFRHVRAHGEQNVLEATREYYRNVSPPVGENVPDLVQLIHWGIGMILVDPSSQDPSGGGDGDRIHAQTVEMLAFFLYAYPSLSEYFTEDFYQQAERLAREQWHETGLFGIIDTIGDAKGRHCPGHSILPNLLMYETAVREGWPEADRYLQAASRQANWVLRTFEPSDPRVGKGQRMSEHKLITGLWVLQRDYAEHAPSALADWLDAWVNVQIARSENLYDYRKYDDGENWSLPGRWNEPGNVAAFPGLAWSVGSLLPESDPRQQQIDIIAQAQIDNLFGRNPLNAASNADPSDFPGTDAGWPRHYGDDICARIELCRGAICSISATEHYPLSPNAGFRHPEGWTAFNAALNVSLSLQTHTTVQLEAEHGDQCIEVRLIAPVDLVQSESEVATIEVVTAEGSRRVQLEETGVNTFEFVGTLELDELGITADDAVTIQHGYGFLAQRVTLGGE